MNIPQMESFVCVARTHSFTKAAQQMHLTQQALSKSIARLEKDLGVELFIRDDRKIAMTEVGQKLLPVAESLLKTHAEHEELIDKIIKQNRSTFTVVFENSVLLNSFPVDLLSRVGDIRIHSFVGHSSPACLKAVQEQKAHCAFCQKPDDLQGLRYFQVIHRYPYVIMSRNHPFAKKSSIQLQDLKEEAHAWLTIDSLFFQQYYSACLAEGFFPRITKEYPALNLVHQAISSSMEITVGIGIFKSEKDGELVRRPLKCDSCILDIGFIYPSEDSKRTELLLSYFKTVKEVLNQA